jgi:hypothetical protein
MSVLDRPDLVPVPLGFCPCAGSPHADGDIVNLVPELSVPAGIKARAFFVNGLTGEMSSVEVQQSIADLWLSMCVDSWTFLADDGAPIPVTAENIVRALPFGKGGREVADKADDLYVESVTAPLVKRLNELSQPGPTPSGRRPTSPRTTSTRKPRSRS